MARSKPPKSSPSTQPAPRRQYDVVPLASLSKKEQEELLRAQTKPLSVALKDQAKNFYLTVGMGISHWSKMEGRLVQIASRLLRTPEAKIGLIMYSIININVWLQIIDDLFVLDGTYPKSLRTWRRISASIRVENTVRVRLAHQSIYQEEELAEGELAAIQAYLRPSTLDTRIQSAKSKPLTMIEILEFTQRVGIIHDKLIALLKLMRKRKALR